MEIDPIKFKNAIIEIFHYYFHYFFKYNFIHFQFMKNLNFQEYSNYFNICRLVFTKSPKAKLLVFVFIIFLYVFNQFLEDYKNDRFLIFLNFLFKIHQFHMIYKL